MKKMTPRFPIFLIALLLFANCAATNHNYFLDGKPTGKNEVRGIFGLSVGNYVDYDVTDETNKPPEISIGKTIKMAPILSIGGPIGVTENIDAGFGLSLAGISGSFRLFSKLCLLNKKHKLGIGLLPAVNLAWTPDSILGANIPNVLNASFYLSLPISYDLSRKFTLVVRPTYGFEASAITVKDNDKPDDEFRKGYRFKGRGLSLGVKIKTNKTYGSIFPEVTFITYDNGTHYVPFVGVAIVSPLLGDEEKKQQERDNQ